MYIQGVDNVFDLKFNRDGVTYGQVFLENERQMSRWHFEVADTASLFDLFRKATAEAENSLSAGLAIPAYEQAIKASHVFNMLQARGVVSQTERAGYIGRIRDLARGCAEKYLASREALGFPMLGAAERALFLPPSVEVGHA